VEILLRQAVTEKTKFPLNEIKSEAAFKDYRLDSPTTAEVIGGVLQILNLSGQIDPWQFAEETLQDVVDAIRVMMGSATSAAAVTRVRKRLQMRTSRRLRPRPHVRQLRPGQIVWTPAATRAIGCATSESTSRSSRQLPASSIGPATR
jgi:hypothetical protein